MAPRARRSHEPRARPPHADPLARRRGGGILRLQLPRRPGGAGRQARPHVARHVLRLLRRQGRPVGRHAGRDHRRHGRPARQDAGFEAGPAGFAALRAWLSEVCGSLPGALGHPRRAARRHRGGRRSPHHQAGPAGAATLDHGVGGSHQRCRRRRHRSLSGGGLHLQPHRPRHEVKASRAARRLVRRAGRRPDRARPSLGLRIRTSPRRRRAARADLRSAAVRPRSRPRSSQTSRRRLARRGASPPR